MKYIINEVESHLSTTIEYLFCGENDGNRKVIIPDMQREYCWPVNGLVKDFIDYLYTSAKENKHTDEK